MVLVFCGVFFGPCNDMSVKSDLLTLVLLNPDLPCLWDSGDPDELASEEENCSRSALVVNYQKLTTALLESGEGRE